MADLKVDSEVRMQEALRDEIINAILSGHHEDAKKKVTSLQDGVVDGDGNTLYHEAVKRQDINLLRWLLSNYQSTIPVSRPNHNGSTCFHIACANGNTAIFHALWEESKVRYKSWFKNTDTDGHTPFHMACLGGQLEVAREIVKKLKDDVVYEANAKGQTALHLAAAGGQLSCVRLLAQYKKLVNAVDTFGATALHYATIAGYAAIVQYLMERCKADKMGETTNRMNLVHAAVASGEMTVVKYVLSRMRNSMHVALTSTGATVIHIATGMGFEDVLAHLLTKPHICRLINHPEMNGWTAGHLAALRNRAECLAILIGFAADVYTVKDKHGMSTYQIMCNNESTAMRKTFPYLFDELDSLRQHRPSEKHRKSSKLRRNGDSSKLSSSYEISENSGLPLHRGRRVKRTPSLSQSDIVRENMDFTKTNPIGDNEPVSLRQRRFQKNNMAFPQNGYTDKMPVMSYQMGRDEDSDDEFHIDDIEQIAETPMRTIQQFNNFTHSTYTPTQSTEDLTKVYLGSDELFPASQTNTRDRASSSNLRPLSDVNVHYTEPFVFPPGETAGTSLPIILNYVNEAEEEEAITIYFHNGVLNTVKVKTVIRKDTGYPERTVEEVDNTEQTNAIIELHTEPKEIRRDSYTSLKRNSLTDSTSSIPAPPLPPPYREHQTDNEMLGIEIPETAKIDTPTESFELQKSDSDEILPPPPPPPPISIPHRSTSPLNELPEKSTSFSDYEFPDGGVTSTMEVTLPTEHPTSPAKPNPATYFHFETIPPTDDEPAQSQSMEFVDSETTAESEKRGEQNHKKVEFGQTEMIPTSPDTVEREYLRFAESELNSEEDGVQSKAAENPENVDGEEQAKDENLPPSVEQEPDYAVLMKKADRPKTDANRMLRRLSSNASDVTETNYDLKSSTAYKFNYRAYKKKISTRHDTVTDLFEYDPIE